MVIIMGKYTKLYEQYQNSLAKANSRLRNLPKGTQAYRAFKKMRYELYSTKSRAKSFKPLSYPRNPKQAAQMIKEIKMMDKFSDYKSTLEENRVVAEENAQKKYSKHKYVMDRDEFIEWVVRSRGFRELAQYDSQRAMDITSKIQEHLGDEDWSDIRDVEDLGKYLNQLISDARRATARSRVTDDPKIRKLLKKEKDKEIREAVFDYLERMTTKWDTN